MDRTTYDNIFLMLLNGDLLLRFGYLIYEEDAVEEDNPDPTGEPLLDDYFLIGLKENPNASSKYAGKGYSSWIYASSTPGMDYSSNDWKDELVDNFLESITAAEYDEVLSLAKRYTTTLKHYHQKICDGYKTIPQQVNPFHDKAD